MNTTLTTHRHQHPPSTVTVPVQHVARRVSLLDRVALRVGLALVVWSRRPLTAPSREERARHVEQQLDTVARERTFERNLLLSTLVR